MLEFYHFYTFLSIFFRYENVFGRNGFLLGGGEGDFAVGGASPRIGGGVGLHGQGMSERVFVFVDCYKLFKTFLIKSVDIL